MRWLSLRAWREQGQDIARAAGALATSHGLQASKSESGMEHMQASTAHGSRYEFPYLRAFLSCAAICAEPSKSSVGQCLRQ